MRYPPSEKLEIIRLVEQSHLPASKTLDKIGVARPTFYRWCDLYRSGGLEALADKPSRPSRVWNRIPDEKRDEIVQRRSMSRNCRRGSSPRASSIRKTILCQKLQSIAYSKRMI